VLVVEDDATNRLIITRILRSHAIIPDIAVNGRHAVDAANAKSYDLIFMDILMPELDGLDATRAIRALLQGRHQPRIVALTASVLPDQQHRYFEAGVNAVLPKPIKLADIANELSRHKTTEPKAG
ncbi:MAG: response regulator, partial [Rariglobus sp.]